MTSLERDRVPSPRPIATKEVPLVNRVEEMNVLKEAVYRAVHGEGGLVFIHGEAGIGKTRLVRELGAYSRSRGVQVLYGRCPALFRIDGVPPYILWKEVIKDYLEACTLEQLYRVIGYYPAEVAKLVPELSQKLRSIPQSFPISPNHEQNRLFEAVSQFITNISREAPLLVVLDDLQWTDPSSLLLLHYLARDVKKTPLLLLGAYRSTDIDSNHPFTPVLAELKRERLPQSVPLKRMSLEDTSEIIRQILEQDNIPPEFCRLVYDKTRGNPFFVEEVIESLKEEGVVYREENRWKIKEVSEIEFPETIKNVVKARIGRLDDDCQNVLTLASFVGNDFTLEAMCAVTGSEKSKLIELMDKMFKTGLIKERVIRGEGICSFADILVRDVVYEEISPLKRKELHGVVGSSLEKIYSKKIDEHFGELASHFLESGDKERALNYFLKAGEKAAKIYANNEAASYFQSALRLLEEKEGGLREKGPILEKLGDIKNVVGEYDTCIKYWSDSLLLWKQLDEREKISRLHRKMANVLWNKMGNAEKAKENHEEALKILEAMPESVELATLYEDIAERVSMGRTGDLTEARSWAEKALELAKKLNANGVIAKSYACLGEILAWLGDIKIDYMERALKIALDNDYIDTAIFAYNDLGAFFEKEENERSFELYTKGFELAKKVGDIFWMSWIGIHLAETYVGMGNMSKAMAFAEESLAFDKKANNLSHLPRSLDEVGLIYQIMGEWDKSEQYYKEALNISQKLDDFQAIADVFWCLGNLHIDKGEYIKAREHFEKMTEVLEKHGAEGSKMWASQWITLTDIELGELDEAKNTLDILQKSFLEMWKRKLDIASVNVLRAKLLRAQKKWEESIEYFEKSLHEFEALDARRWNMYFFAKMVLYEYAQTYLERDHEGDRQKALNLLNQALEIFQKMGAKKDIEKTEAKLLYIETGKTALVPKPRDFVATGHADLDKLLCGGLRSCSAVVLTSPLCNERDSLIKSFLKTGVEKGEVTFYLTTSARAVKKTLTEKPQPNSYLFVCNPQADTLAESSPNVIKLKGVENLTEISIALTSTIHKLDPSWKGLRRACIEIVSDVLLQHHAVQTRKWLTALTTEFTSTGFTVLAVVDPQMHPLEELHAILGLFDGEINIYEKGAEKLLRIKRMSDQEYLEDELPLTRERAH